MNVAIIDSGIDNRYLKDIEYGINFFFDENDKISMNHIILDENGHGTFIYRLLKKVCKSENNYYIFKILNANKEGEYSILLESLHYVLKYDIKIVVLCVATDTYTKDLVDIMNEMYKRDIIVISSLRNNALKSYPAIMKQVIGVRGEKLDYENYYCFNDNEIQITCSSFSLYGFDAKGRLYRFGGNSKAAALFAGILINLIQDDDSLEIVQEKIRYYSNQNIKDLNDKLHITELNDEIIKKFYSRTLHLHKTSYKDFISSSIWEMFDSIEKMTDFVRVCVESYGIDSQDILIHENEFVCIDDLLKNIINFKNLNIESWLL